MFAEDKPAGQTMNDVAHVEYTNSHFVAAGDFELLVLSLFV